MAPNKTIRPFKIDQTGARSFVFEINSNSIKVEITTWNIRDKTLGKLVSKLELKLEKWKKLELAMYFNSKFWSSMKFEIDEKWAYSSTTFAVSNQNI